MSGFLIDLDVSWKGTPCWIWKKSTYDTGYGMIGMRKDGKSVPERTHRLAWMLLVGDIPEGKELDHLCRRRRCGNPAHLEPVEHVENMNRSPFCRVNVSIALKASNIAKRAMTHCKRAGHEYTPENTILDKNGGRKCRACQREKIRLWMANKRVENKAKTGFAAGRSQAKSRPQESAT